MAARRPGDLPAAPARPATPAVSADTGELILVADDELLVRRVLAAFFQQHGYEVIEAADGVAALKLVLSRQPALVILDVEMPELGGLAVLSRVREAGCTTPVLILSHRGATPQRVEGLTLGADDYLPKPFDYDELLARARALLRRQPAAASAPRQFLLGDAQVDLDRMVVATGAGEIRLSATECAILDLLVRRQGRPVARELMMDAIWGYTPSHNTRTLDTHIWRLRRKLGDDGREPQWIVNIPGVGYQLAPPAPVPADRG